MSEEKQEKVDAQKLAQFIDHTILKPDATKDDVRKVCKEALRYNFKTVCVNSHMVAFAAELLKASSTEHCPIPIAVVGFPLGAGLSSAKAFEAKKALEDGAKEIDMVINVGRLRERDYKYVLEDIQAVVNASRPCPVKVILETCLLTEEEKIIACALSKAAGAAFVKTSTGFSKGGATISDIKLMNRVAKGMGIKASGGIRSRGDAISMIEAGATRIGASKSVQIVTGVAGKASEGTY